MNKKGGSGRMTVRDKVGRGMSESHYGSSKQSFMSARTYDRRTVNEQNAGKKT